MAGDNHFGTGNAATKFVQLDDYVVDRLRQFMVRRKGRNLRPGESRTWKRKFFEAYGLYRLRGTVKLPGTTQAEVREPIGKPCAGNSHARFERGPYSLAVDVKLEVKE